ncbi:hypothetical protein TraAM80_05130 [Trypanosoma rangeli]|uniref:Uncharacterized protein n=1 Tax=Trypanosoma rangeli TaxID=5698 RepID=A0A422NG89_TRYRA|nr:uncharacterized protein TraAM80_05130 [Trypanosoma rangeli]RNF04481.1 hypothetical protein TraAM80_05130 [Trypanosoma rangeli]|eukprot:RNF04481.1 hypothetical protein TraAM80_05130 [Trypanosoma rangeli]
MRRSHALIFGAASGCFRAAALSLWQHRRGGGGGLSNINGFAKIFSQAKTNSSGNGSSSDFLNGRFEGGSATMDPSMLQNMHRTLNQSLTPEVQESMRAMMEGLKRGDGIPQMGMMAFGVGENEKGKKVARGAKLTFDPNTGKVSKDFLESQLEEDDPMLPKGTVGDYHTEGAIEVEFEEDSRRHASTVAETISEADVVLEGTSESLTRGGKDTTQ